ncbi:MAG: hypothetical protein KKH94_10350 [Candidatus Omnitrophica bacterium]|nr:hypothetical protein [Candidatus Omnitrophota bacterium]
MYIITEKFPLLNTMKKLRNNELLQFEISFYEKLIKENPDFVDALIPLADAYTKIGKYKKGLEIDKKLVTLKHNDETAFYNLACSYALLKMTNKSFEALQKAIALGYHDIAYLQNDPDLQNIQTDTRFSKLIAHLRTQRKLLKEKY